MERQLLLKSIYKENGDREEPKMSVGRFEVKRIKKLVID
jgi:hypothetical protein